MITIKPLNCLGGGVGSTEPPLDLPRVSDMKEIKPKEKAANYKLNTVSYMACGLFISYLTGFLFSTE